MSNITDKTFRQWTTEELLGVFGLSEKNQCLSLDNWLNTKCSLSDFEEKNIQKYQQKAQTYTRYWKEAELRDNFIAPMISLVDFNAYDYFLGAFSERTLVAELDDVLLTGKVDWVLALGHEQPHAPFFFIHEYKKEQGTSNDPLAQLLSAMLAAQILNQKPFETPKFKPLIKHDPNMPVYGCYIIGSIWRFVVLQGKQYCVSTNFDATDLEKLRQIVRILKAQKQITVSKLRKVSDAIV